MRIRRLRLEAFGPFADPVDLGFDDLNDAGLFLLTGSNGAGKSSVLDAVSFALYGAVPGERNAAKRYRSDHARDGQPPRVELEAAFADGVYRIVRTAAWERPKKRGTGTTPQQASVSVSRRVGDGWQPVTTRIDEAGHLVTRLVGMSLTQFCQVVILPQGRFQAFLEASAPERQALLEQLFHTGRFKRVEQWLRDHRQTLRRETQQCEQVVLELASRVSEVAGEPVPEGDVGEPLVAWARACRDRSTAAREESVGHATAAARLDEEARDELDRGREVAARLSRRRTAEATLARLALQTDAVAEARDRLDRARRAEPLSVLAPLVTTAEAECSAALAAVSEAGQALTAIRADVPDDPRAAAVAVRERLDRLRVLLPRADEADRLASQLAASAARRTADEEALARAAASPTAALLDQLSGLREELLHAQPELAAAEARVTGLQERLAAHADLVALAAEHAEAVTAAEAARSATLDAKDVWLTVREARIDGMAAELAGGLAVGCGCPVCGSVDHPSPAHPRVGAPDSRAEKAAHKALDDAGAAELAHEMRVRDLAGARDRARAAAGTEPARDVRRDVAAATADRDALLARLAELPGVERRLHDTTIALDEENRQQQQLREQLAGRVAADDQVTARLEEIRRELADALTDSDGDDLRDEVSAAVSEVAALDAVVHADERHRQARRGAADSRGRMAEAARSAGFASVDDALAGVLGNAERDRLTELVTGHETATATVTQALADPELAELDGVPAPDLEALAVGQRETSAARSRAEASAAGLTRAEHRLQGLLAELEAGVQEWVPVRERLELVAHLASFCEGKSPDNRRQMQLSAYVVAWRLSQVAAAANVRLAAMTHGRYSLEHTHERNAGDRRGGLGLVVRDDWTGVTRDPVTLSGGESFVVALALALGLADVITTEAGGASLQTLFVDEGFGSLDPGSLDLVMDTLDGLRASGRVVGVVSHVPEMRTRIPAQIRIHKPADHGPSTALVRA